MLMSETRILCIFSRLLGKKTITAFMTEALERLPGVAPTCVFLDNEDYDRYPAPYWARASEAWHTQWIARRKAREVVGREFDILLVNTWEFVVAFSGLARRMPAAAIMDGVPANFRAQGRHGWLTHQVHDLPFRNAVKRFRYFLPKGSDCRDALCGRYGIPRDRCVITLAPQLLDVWKPEPRSYAPPLRLLFVSNNFVGKGGDFLLKLYADYLSGMSVLTIASNDPVIEKFTLPAGVTWLRGLHGEELIEVYRQSDLFVFPTRGDFTPGVLGEALAMGLPSIATDLDGVRDLVQDERTGFRLPCDAPAEVWAEKIKDLAQNPQELCRMSRCARHFAEEVLGRDRFERMFIGIIEELLGMVSVSRVEA